MARIAKYPPLSGFSFDYHSVLPPSVPPPPPAPPNPVLIPSHVWVVTIINQIGGFALTGKWSWSSTTTEGIGNILFGHDWGTLQPHIPMPPVLVTPSIPVRLVGSATKYWLPSFSVQEPQDGSARGGPGAVAVSTPVWLIPTQNCQDIAGWPFFLPLSFSFQMVSTRWVAFTVADLFAGVIAVAADSVAALISRRLGGAPSNPLNAAIAGALTGPFLDHVTAFLPPDVQGPAKIMLAGAFAIGLGSSSADVVGAMMGPASGYGAGQAANAMTGDSSSSSGSGSGAGAGGSS